MLRKAVYKTLGETMSCKRLMSNGVLATVIFTASASTIAKDYRYLYGTPAQDSAATRTVTIGSDTRYVNVEGGEIVRFVADGNAFTWHFNVARTVSSFDLNDVAPAGFLQNTVRAYVTPDPRYLGAS